MTSHIDVPIEEESSKIVAVVKDCYYYYGIYAYEFKDHTYEEALNIKINAAKELVGNLLIDGYISSDVYRLNDVLEAIAFNKKLLDEIK